MSDSRWNDEGELLMDDVTVDRWEEVCDRIDELESSRDLVHATVMRRDKLIAKLKAENRMLRNALIELIDAPSKSNAVRIGHQIKQNLELEEVIE